MARKTTKKSPKKVETLTHEEASRKNIPTAEYESVMDDGARDPIKVAYERRNEDLDPQLVWRGKDVENWSDLVVDAPPLYIQEKVHPKVLVDDLLRRSKTPDSGEGEQIDLFADFNGVPEDASRTEFYEHDANWTNRMILGDSLQVMASLAEREGLRGKVQCIYIDPPYGIRFNSNFQWSTTNRDVKDGKAEHITREPEQVKAFRDTWRDGIHSYLSYLRDRLLISHDLLNDTGSIFVQIGDENVHRVRVLMDEVFGPDNFISMIAFKTSVPLGSTYIPGVLNYLLMYAKKRDTLKYRRIFQTKQEGEGAYTSIQLPNGRIRTLSVKERKDKSLVPEGARYLFNLSMLSAGRTPSCVFTAEVAGRRFEPGGGKSWKTNPQGMARLEKAGRLYPTTSTIRYLLFHDDYPVSELTDIWSDSSAATDKTYVVQTNVDVVQRCLLMASDPGDLVLDPTCGSGTTAAVAERWGRRWITIDTSRVALALARSRIMGARYPFYSLADSLVEEGDAAGEAEARPTRQEAVGSVRGGFVYRRVPHITLRSIANNAAVDAIWERWQEELDQLRSSLNAAIVENWEEWEVPYEPDDSWDVDVRKLHEDWLAARHERQREIDEAIAATADYEYLYDQPLEEKAIVRVAGPFTVESVSPHRMLGLDEEEAQVASPEPDEAGIGSGQTFVTSVLDNLKVAGVQQTNKEDKLNFVSLGPWPGRLIAGEGRYREGNREPALERRAAIFIGPEFGTVSRVDLVEAAREAADAGFDVLVACAFNYEAHASELDQLGKVPVLKARMNADLHMAEDLKNTGQGNLFVIFGEPDIELLEADGDGAESGQLQVKVNGVDVFDPSSGEVRSDDVDGIACWFVDTDYNEESFFVRQAYFLGANDPYKALKTTLKAEIDEDAWASLNSDVSRPFDKPESGRIAVKVINHLGDEVMKVLRVD